MDDIIVYDEAGLKIVDRGQWLEFTFTVGGQAIGFDISKTAASNPSTFIQAIEMVQRNIA